LDLAVAGRIFLKNPGLVWDWAEDLDTEIQAANQIRWGFGGRVGAKKTVKGVWFDESLDLGESVRRRGMRIGVGSMSWESLCCV